MSDVKLFRIANGSAEELVSRPVKLEKHLQEMIERHLETFLHVRFVASEYSTGKTHAGRIDTLGIDENSCPTIIEYKRNSNANVINQGLFYLDWLMDHQAEFELLVQRQFGHEAAEQIDWTSPRLLCIAEDFTKYDVHAVQQINRNIELIRYMSFGDSLLLLDLVNAVSANGSAAPASAGESQAVSSTARKYAYPTHEELLAKASPELRQLYDAVCDYMDDLGDEVQAKSLQNYVAYKRLRNFACIMVTPIKNRLLVYLKVDPSKVNLEEGFSRDVRNIGHFGTGDLELSVSSLEDFEKAKPLIQQSFEEN